MHPCRLNRSDSIHLRLLAPIVEAAQTGDSTPVDPELRAEAERICQCPPELLWTELTAALCARHPHVALQALHDRGLLVVILPELAATVECSDPAGRHKNVWEHTKTVVWQSVPRPAVRWAAALHDIGKVPTRQFTPDGKVTFHGHAAAGVRMFERGPAERIAFPAELSERVAELIRHHQRPGQYDNTWTDTAIRRFTRELGPHLDDLLLLSRADITTKRPAKRKACLRSITELARRIRELEIDDRRPKPLPAGLGHTLMTELRLGPGRHIGELRARLQALVEAGTIEGGREPDYYVAQVRARELLSG